MHRLIGFLLILLCIYYVAKQRNGGINPLETPKVTEDSLEYYKTPEYLEKGPKPEFEGTSFEKTISKVIYNIMKTEKGRIILEKMVRPVHSSSQDRDFSIAINNRVALDNMLNIKTKEQGIGRQAICGHKVEVDYRIINMQDMVLDSGQKVITLGNKEIFQGLDNVVVGMKEEELRSAIIPEKLAYENRYYIGKKPINRTSDYRLEVKLLKVLSHMDIDESVRIFDNMVSLKIPMMCGDRATFHAKIEEIGGKTLLDSYAIKRPITFELGNKFYPLLFSYALFNKDDKGARFVITPGKYLKLFNSEVFTILDRAKISDSNYYMVQFSNISYMPH